MTLLDHGSYNYYISLISFVQAHPYICFPLCLSTQLCWLSEDLAAFPHAHGHYPHGGPGIQPAVTRTAGF